jgi:hypothetical protein
VALAMKTTHSFLRAHRKKRERQLLRALFPPPPSSHQTAQIQLKGPESEILTRAINQYGRKVSKTRSHQSPFPHREVSQ